MNKKSTIYILIFLTTLFIQCSKIIDEAYKNPNFDVRVPVETLLPQIISSMAANGAGHGPLNDIRYVGQYIQNFSYINGGDASTQSFFERMGYNNNDVAQSTWRTHYYDIGQNNLNMINWATEEERWDYVGVGKAIFAWSWLMLTDYYGDVILDEAFNNNGNSFTYQKQEEVYKFVKKLCFESLTFLNRTDGNVSSELLAKGDAYFYNGDISKWKKFVYGILARVNSRGSIKSDFNADSVIKYCDLSIQSNSDNGYVKFAATALSATNNFFGPFRSNLTGASTSGATNVKQSKFIVDLMTGVSGSAFEGVFDPRSFYLLRINNSKTYKGVESLKGQGILGINDRPESFWGVAGSATIYTTNSDTNCRYIFRNSSPIPIITASEISFLKAEAAFRKGDKSTALLSYKNGIDQNIEMLRTNYNANLKLDSAITATKKTNFFNNIKIVPTNENLLNLTQIMLQKYISLYIHGAMETWVDMRKNHYTDIDPATGSQIYKGFNVPSQTDLFPDNNGKLVYRVRPRFNSEYVWNITELKRIGATDLDYHTVQTWFSIK